MTWGVQKSDDHMINFGRGAVTTLGEGGGGGGGEGG